MVKDARIRLGFGVVSPYTKTGNEQALDLIEVIAVELNRGRPRAALAKGAALDEPRNYP